MGKELAITFIMILLGSVQSALADNHGARAAEQKGMEHLHVEGMTGLLLKQETVVDSYQLTFHVTKANDPEVIGCEYRLMFKAEHNGRPVKDLIVNSRVVHPNSQSESKMMMKSGEWYAAAYDLTHPGKHDLRVLFKSREGAVHAAGVTYIVEKQE